MTKMTRRSPVVLLAVLLMAVAPIGLTRRAGSAHAAGNTLTVAFSTDIVTLDPHQNTDLNTMQVLEQIYEHLVALGRDGTFHPVLAESWELVDERTWKFKLRRGVHFHNGEDFTADAVKFTLERLADTKDPVRSGPSFRQNLAEVVVQDPLTVLIRTKAPYPDLLALLHLSGSVIPPKYFQSVGKERFAREPNGTGPYRFAAWRRDVQVTLQGNERYWGGKPAFGEFVYRPIPEAAARVAALVKGEIDVAADVPAERVKELESGRNTRVVSYPGQQIYIGIDTLKTGPLRDRRVRQALNYGIDVDAIVRDVLGGQAVRLNGPMFPTMVGYDPKLKAYPYDPERAKELLAQAGYPGGFSVTLDVPVGYQGAMKLKDVGETVVSYLKKLGVDVTLNLIEPAAATERYQAKQFQMYFYAWGGDYVSGRILEILLYSKTRGYYYQSPEADSMIAAYQGTMNLRRREELGRTLHRFLHEDAPFVFLYQERATLGLAKRLVWEPIVSDQRLHAAEFRA
jgi:peptide/nickel transport system substrate-binding protein